MYVHKQFLPVYVSEQTPCQKLKDIRKTVRVFFFWYTLKYIFNIYSLTPGMLTPSVRAPSGVSMSMQYFKRIVKVL